MTVRPVCSNDWVRAEFEALAQSITRDVHPRSMLDELVRLGLVQHDEDLDSVSLARSEFRAA